MSIDSVSVFGNFSGNRINSFAPAVMYCRNILLLTSLQKSASPLLIDADWERKLNVLFHSDKVSFNTIKEYVASIDQNSLQIYLSAAFEGMLYSNGNELKSCGQCFVDILRVAPRGVVGNFSERAFELLPSIKSNNSDARLCAARVYGILIPHPTRAKDVIEDEILALLQDITAWKSAFGADLNKVNGSILALGFVLSKIAYYHRRDMLESSVIKKCVSRMLEVLVGAENKTTKEAVLSAVGKISAAGILTASHLNEFDLGMARIIEILRNSANKGDENSISTLGRLSLILGEDDLSLVDGHHSLLSSIMTSLTELVEVKQIEVQFTIGEAITCLAACWESDLFFRELDVETTYTGRPKRKLILESLLQKLLVDCKNPKPSLKRASGIWLFSLIQNCGHLNEIQTRLRECQRAFMGLLSSRDENVQETASRGLSLVYEQGDSNLKKSLVRDLVSSFTGPSSQLKVHEETELFEPGALPTGEGNSVTSYKDIISLANEVGDQSLVYKFMSLASNAATWTTRAAFGRFGLSNILSESEIDPKIYPKLYRYRFDPNPNVRRSMNDIWKAVVKDSKTTINLHFQPILNDLLQSILGKEWRTRQASCTALADLVQGQEFEKYEKNIHEIWQVAFKVLDDIKESVREASQSLSIVLTNILVRQVEIGTSSKHSQLILKDVLPFLLSEQGIESSTKNVRAFASATVLRLIKHGGQVLRPIVPDLVEKLLGLLSTIEPEEVNYVYQRASEHRDQIDQIRSSAVSQSPIMEAIERCLDLLDEPTMKLLAPRLEISIKTMIGMPSKIGCASVLISLTTRRSNFFRPFAKSFLKILEKAVLDRNNTVSFAFSKATGYVSGLASDNALSELSCYCKEIYFKSDNENKRHISGEIIYAIGKFSSERFSSMISEFLPFVFFATHDTDHEVKKKFQNSWNEHVGGSRAVMLYSKEIIELSIKSLESPNWAIKHSAALTIADVIKSFGAKLDERMASVIWPALEKAINLKIFDGKEKLLQEFVKFVGSVEKFWKEEIEMTNHMKKIIIREANRNNVGYRVYSFEALGDFSEMRRDLNMFDEVFNIVFPFCEKFLGVSQEENRTDDAMDCTVEASEVLVLTAGISSIFKAVNENLTGEEIIRQLRALARTIKPVMISLNMPITIKVAIFERIKITFCKLNKQPSQNTDENWDLVWEYFLILELEKDFGSESMRLKRAEACEALVQALVSGLFGSSRAEENNEKNDKVRKLIELSKANEISSNVLNVLDSCQRKID